MSTRKVWQPKNPEYRAEAIARLREFFPIGADVPTVLRNVSRSGMSRVITVLGVSPASGEIVNLSYDVARILDSRFDDERNGVYVEGCGMDMGFHLVYTLSQTIYKDTVGLEQHREGYALKHRWV